MSIVCTRMSHACNLYVTRMYGNIIHMSLVCARILSIFTRMPFVCQSHVLVYHLYVTRMYLYVMLCHSYILASHRTSLVYSRMSLVCFRMSLACYPYVTRMYSYVIRMSLVCTRMSSVCHSYVVLPCHFFIQNCQARFMVKPHISGMQVTQEYIRVTYE